MADKSGIPSRGKPSVKRWYLVLILLAPVVLLLGILLPQNPSGIRMAQENAAVQQAHGLALAMFQYATDHEGNYPAGKNSTEVFQKLIDGRYITNVDPLYLPLPGKRKARPGNRLKPENVGWDITTPVDSNSPDRLPIIFMTGYKVNYTLDTVAIPLINPWPPTPTSLEKWWNHSRPAFGDIPGIAVAYKDLKRSFSACG